MYLIWFSTKHSLLKIMAVAQVVPSFLDPMAHYCAPKRAPDDAVLSCSLRFMVSRPSLNILLLLVSHLRPCFSRACLSFRYYNSNLCALHRSVLHIHPSSP